MYLDTDKTKVHIFIAAIRVILFIGLIWWYTSWNSLITGFVYGAATYKAIIFVLNQYMFHVEGCESLPPFDEWYWYDDDISMSNIVAPIFFENFDFEVMRETIFKNSENVHKCRSKVILKFG